MDEQTRIPQVWGRPIFWVTVLILSVVVAYGLGDIVNEFVLLFAICVIFFAPFMVIGTSTGHTKGGLAVGVIVVALYLAAVWYVNIFGS
jgi:hypothetical protein